MYQELIDNLKKGNAILTAGSLHEDIPTIHNVSNHPDAILQVDDEVRHAGFGLFLAKVGDTDISFNGGGAMRRVENESESYSYTFLSASPKQLESMGYDIDKVLTAVKSLTE